MFRHKDFSELDSFKYTLYCGLGKEIIDAYVPYEKYGKSGIICRWNTKSELVDGTIS